MFKKILIANRGEIARRITRTCRDLGVGVTTVHSEADADALHVREADSSTLLGPAASAESYLKGQKIIDAAVEAGAEAIHPGYGFLAENPDFAAAVIDAGLAWIGPSPDVIRSMGNKINARNVMMEAGVPVARGSNGAVADIDTALREANDIGYPLMIKASGGGGGIGITIVRDEAELRQQFAATVASSSRFFGSTEVFLEKFLSSARHVEIQILGLNDGRIVVLGDRDCSVQRRNQKLLEETPSPGVGSALRARMYEAARLAGEAIGYRGAGTVECLVDESAQDFIFLEMNTRLQVEHPVTEFVTGIDLVEQQLRVAAGMESSVPNQVDFRGHAIELRICAEDSVRFIPRPGKLLRWHEPSGENIRVDSGFQTGDVITPFYDSLLAKLVVHGSTRAEALELALRAVDEFEIEGPASNLEFFKVLLRNEEFISGRYDTGIVARINR